MSIQIDTSTFSSANKTDVLHSLPCRIEFDGQAKVAEFFTTGIRIASEKDGTAAKDVSRASFRGRPLHGTQVAVPEGYTGIVLKEFRKPFSEEEDREFKVTHSFSHFTHWNLDLDPSVGDKVHQAFDWMDLASAIHEPVVDSEEEDKENAAG